MKDDRVDGMAIDKQKFTEQGRVPLFYVDGDERGDEPLKVYLSRKDLVAEWKGQHPGAPFPTVRAVDLVGIFDAIVRDRSSVLPTANFEFVPNSETVEVAKELKNRGLAPYDPNRMII
jgi:hypothetical protein